MPFIDWFFLFAYIIYNLCLLNSKRSVHYVQIITNIFVIFVNTPDITIINITILPLLSSSIRATKQQIHAHSTYP